MGSLKQKLLTNWHAMRILRAAMGLWLLIGGIQMHEWVAGLFSLFFLYQAVTDTGCCGTSACYTPPARKVQATKDVEYEEIK